MLCGGITRVYVKCPLAHYICAVVAVFCLLATSSISFAEEPVPTRLRARLAGWPDQWSVYATSDSHGLLVASFVHATLLTKRLDNGEFYPYLAKSYDVSKDGKTYHFVLHPDATFSSGASVTARDVVFSYSLALSGQYCQDCKHLAHMRFALKDLKVTGLYSLQVTLNTPGAHHGEIFAMLPVLEEKYYGGLNLSKASLLAPIGAGSYSYDVKNSQYRKKIVLKKRPQPWLARDAYFMKQSRFDIIELILIEDDQSAYQALLDERIDVLYFTDEMVKYWGKQQKNSLGQQSRIAWHMSKKREPFSVKQMIFNTQKGVLKDKAFRQALFHLFDGKSIMSRFYKTHFEWAQGPLFLGKLPLQGSLRPDFDVKKAISLLSSIGYRDKDKYGLLFRLEGKQKSYSKAQVSILYSHPHYTPWLENYAQLAKKVGVDIWLQYMGFSDLYQNMLDGTFDVVVLDEQKSAHTYPLVGAYGGFSHEYSKYPLRTQESFQKALKAGKSTKELQRYMVTMAKEVVQGYAVMYLWQRRYHHIGYIRSKVTAADPLLTFSGNDSFDVYYRHWQQADK
ncbi:MAG: ABC transporter substrate-binding protein [Proteobacteria bacterium]|nr:ABC transporter substrate-binding protein [Pseudomonadota bacterium]